MPSGAPSSDVTTANATLRWRIAVLVSAGIAISYLDRQTFPVAIGEIGKEIHISNSTKGNLDSAFLLTYGLMYLGGGRLMDILGTRRGFLIIMVFWSLACASHGFAGGVIALAASRLLLGMGEGGGFPAATRVVAEWFPVKERATAMGIINAGTGVGGIIAPPLIAWIILHTGWFGVSSWRWVFFITGALGLLWTVWWAGSYFPPATHRKLSGAEREYLRPVMEKTDVPPPQIPMLDLLPFRETWGVIGAKFLSRRGVVFLHVLAAQVPAGCARL